MGLGLGLGLDLRLGLGLGAGARVRVWAEGALTEGVGERVAPAEELRRKIALGSALPLSLIMAKPEPYPLTPTPKPQPLTPKPKPNLPLPPKPDLPEDLVGVAHVLGVVHPAC